MTIIKLAALAATLPFAAHAAEMMTSGQGVEHIMGATSVLTYYVNTTDGFHLVATMNQVSGDPASVLRFAAKLADGQQVVMSMPRALGERSRDIIFQREGERLMITETDELVGMR